MKPLTGTTTDQAPADPPPPTTCWPRSPSAIGAVSPTRPSPGICVMPWPSPADGPHEIARVIDQLVDRGWLLIDTGRRVHLTEAGEAARARLRELVSELRAVVHEGISDEEYVAALKVLRKMVANVEGDSGVTAQIP
jgi:hypothetical protein